MKKAVKKIVEVRSNVNKGVKKGEDKKAGVIQTIIDLLTKKQYSRETLLEEMVKQFPEREESAMKLTINAQLSNEAKRLRKERGLEVKITMKKEVMFYKITGKAEFKTEEEGEE